LEHRGPHTLSYTPSTTTTTTTTTTTESVATTMADAEETSAPNDTCLFAVAHPVKVLVQLLVDNHGKDGDPNDAVVDHECF